MLPYDHKHITQQISHAFIDSKNSFLIIATKSFFKRFNFPYLQCTAEQETPYNPWSMLMSPDDSLFFTSEGHNNGIRYYCSNTLSLMGIIAISALFSRMISINRSGLIVGGTIHGHVNFYSLETKNLIREIRICKDFITAFTANKDQSHLIIADISRYLTIFNLENFTTLKAVKLKEDTQCIQFSKDEKEFFASSSKTIYLYSFSDFKILKIFPTYFPISIELICIIDDEIFTKFSNAQQFPSYHSFVSQELGDKEVVANLNNKYFLIQSVPKQKIEIFNHMKFGIDGFTHSMKCTRKKIEGKSKLSIQFLKDVSSKLKLNDKSLLRLNSMTATFHFFKGSLFNGTRKSRAFQSFIKF